MEEKDYGEDPKRNNIDSFNGFWLDVKKSKKSTLKSEFFAILFFFMIIHSSERLLFFSLCLSD